MAAGATDAPAEDSTAEAAPDARALATELADALRFAAAAYGVAMADGHMDSVLKTTYMWTARPLVTGVDVRSTCRQTQDDAVRAQIGAGDLLHSDWSGGVFRPCHFVAYHQGRNWLVLAVRGTLRPDDLLTDACAVPCRFEDGFAHEGVSRAAQYVVSQAAGVLAAAAARRPGCEIVVTGHSMGAATATLAASLLRSQGRKHPGASASAVFSSARCIAFAPLPVLSDALATNEDQRLHTLSVVCGADFAPRLSIPALSLLKEELGGAGFGATLGRGVRRLRRIMDVGGTRALSPPRAGTAASDDEGLESERLRMGGRVLYLRSAPHAATEQEQGRVGCWADTGDFDRLWLTDGCLSDHLVSHYQQSLAALLSASASEEARQQLAESQRLGHQILARDIASAKESGESFAQFKARYRPVGVDGLLAQLWYAQAADEGSTGRQIESDSERCSERATPMERADLHQQGAGDEKEAMRLKTCLHPHEAAGFPRGLRKTEQQRNDAATAAAEKSETEKGHDEEVAVSALGEEDEEGQSGSSASSGASWVLEDGMPSLATVSVELGTAAGCIGTDEPDELGEQVRQAHFEYESAMRDDLVDDLVVATGDGGDSEDTVGQWLDSLEAQWDNYISAGRASASGAPPVRRSLHWMEPRF